MVVVIVVVIAVMIVYSGTGGTVAHSTEVASAIVDVSAGMVIVEVATVPAVQHTKV